ncbi:peptidoglycan-binding domain-containing protein [Streptomyces albidoflavus]|uniref:peptidoglycan-binding domain-containing protein n=1 Tax=Streptomyces albidoflavus TaxID=1886 RepID=UPI001F5C5222|nr:peptidoglycan-binding domain-containing protein [Streptomyces albidoflavus]
MDREFGPATVAAVKDFQGKQGAEVDGVMGPQAWRYVVSGRGRRRRGLLGAEQPRPPGAEGGLPEGRRTRRGRPGAARRFRGGGGRVPYEQPALR